jgi:hypothetical protein
MGDNSKRLKKKKKKILKVFFSRTNKPISMKLVTKLSTESFLGKEFQECSSKGLVALQRGKIQKLGLFIIFFSRTNGPEMIKFIWKILDIMLNQVVFFFNRSTWGLDDAIIEKIILEYI